MTTRLCVGFILRAVTADTDCWTWVLHFFHPVQPCCLRSTRRKAGTMCYVFLTFDQYFLSHFFFSVALLCFLLSHEVDPYWACHVRPLCMWVSFVCLSQHTLAAHTRVWGLVRWPLLSDEVNCVFATIHQLYVCLRAPPHVCRHDCQRSRAVMATWCFLLRGCSCDAMLWLRRLPGWSVVATVHHGRTELSGLILHPAAVQIIFLYLIYVFHSPRVP